MKSSFISQCPTFVDNQNFKQYLRQIDTNQILLLENRPSKLTRHNNSYDIKVEQSRHYKQCGLNIWTKKITKELEPLVLPCDAYIIGQVDKNSLGPVLIKGTFIGVNNFSSSKLGTNNTMIFKFNNQFFSSTGQVHKSIGFPQYLKKGCLSYIPVKSTCHIFVKVPPSIQNQNPKHNNLVCSVEKFRRASKIINSKQFNLQMCQQYSNFIEENPPKKHV